MPAWVKGQSGNPKGRPKDPELTELAKSYTRETIERLVFWLRSDNPKASVTAANILLDRAHGKARQPVDIDGVLTTQYAALPVPVEQRNTDAVESPTWAATNGGHA